MPNIHIFSRDGVVKERVELVGCTLDQADQLVKGVLKNCEGATYESLNVDPPEIVVECLPGDVIRVSTMLKRKCMKHAKRDYSQFDHNDDIG